MALGGRNADEPYVTCARIFSAIYFLFFFAISRFTTSFAFSLKKVQSIVLKYNEKAQKLGHKIFKAIFPNVQFHSNEYLAKARAKKAARRAKQR